MMRVQTKGVVNFNNRLRIEQGDVSIVTGLNEAGGASYRLMRCDLPEEHGDPQAWNEAHVIVEARRLSTDSSNRAVVGTVADVRARAGEVVWSQDLPGFVGLSTIKFRVKVVCARTRLLFAEAETVLADNERPRDRTELLPVVPLDLGELVWRLAPSEEDGMPELHIHSEVTARSGHDTPEFRCLVLPEAVRQALRIAVAAREDDETDPEWIGRWLAYARSVAGNEPGEAEGEGATSAWIGLVASRFAAAQKCRDGFLACLDRSITSERD